MLNFNALKLTHRYSLVFLAYSASMVAVIAMSWFGLMSARDSLRTLHDESLQRILLADAMTESALQSRMQVLLAFQHAPDSPMAGLHDHPVTAHLETVRENLDRSRTMQKDLVSRKADAQEQAILEEVVRVEQAWVAKLEDFARALAAGDFSPELMGRVLAAGREEGDMLVGLVGAFKGLQVSKADIANQDAEQRYSTGIWVFIAAVILGAVPATLLSLSLLQRMRQGFQQAQAAAQAIAEGDISQRVPVSGKDEITDLLGQMEAMRVHLHQIIAQVRSGSEAIAGASTQVAVGTQDLSMRTEQQAASLEQTASATEELSSTVQQNADSAVKASELAVSATGVAQRGGEMVAQVVQTMEDINTSSRKIEDIIAVIDGIAFQTNILALNAAVEAARAGEQGRGFAVVAGEVRSLAGRSAEAAKEVKMLITASVDRVRVGTEQVDRAGATMQDIVQGIQRVADIVSEIADASREQSKGLVQINAAVANLDDVTQQNAALVEETSAASSSLQEQARQLAGMAAKFVLEGGAGHSTGYRPAAGPASLGGGTGGRPVATSMPAPRSQAAPTAARAKAPALT